MQWKVCEGVLIFGRLQILRYKGSRSLRVGLQKEPVATRVAMFGPVLQEGTKRGNARSRTDHNHVPIRRR